MSAPVQDFAATGTRLMQLLAGLATASKGTFPGAATAALSIIATYCRAGCNAFRLLAADPGMSNAQMLAAMAAATQFETALGAIATQFGTSAALSTSKPLTAGSGQSGLADLFPPSAALVTVTPAATAALEVLGRDPLMVSTPAGPGIMQLMAVSAAGVMIP